MKVRFKLTSSVTGKTVVLTLKGDEESVQKVADHILGYFKYDSKVRYDAVKVGAVRVPT